MKKLPLALLILSTGPLLAGDLNVTSGNLNVDYSATIGVSSATKGNLTVNGKTGAGSGLNLQITGDGGFYFPASTSTTLAPVITSGNGLFYYPAKGALRLGSFNSYSISNANVGTGSFATGGMASGIGSLALGGTASGNGSLAMGGTASGNNSLAIGASTASGEFSIAAGYNASASGGNSIAVGGYASAVGGVSAAFNSSTTAIGTCSSAFGYYTTAQAGYSMAVGRYNTLEGDPATWVATDPLFVIGNGTGTATAQRSNAFVVKKNGDVVIPKAQGDILMGEFGN